PRPRAADLARRARRWYRAPDRGRRRRRRARAAPGPRRVIGERASTSGRPCPRSERALVMSGMTRIVVLYNPDYDAEQAQHTSLDVTSVRESARAIAGALV